MAARVNGLQAGGSTLVPRSAVHKLFGLDVQVPIPVNDGGDSKGQRPRQRANSHSNGGGSPPAEVQQAHLESQQFMKFFHLVPVQVRDAGLERVLQPGSV